MHSDPHVRRRTGVSRLRLTTAAFGTAAVLSTATLAWTFGSEAGSAGAESTGTVAEPTFSSDGTGTALQESSSSGGTTTMLESDDSNDRADASSGGS